MARAKVQTKKSVLETYILLDRSGSMRTNWDETIGAMNAYVAELAADDTSSSSLVTLAAFDAGRTMDYSVLRGRVIAREWVPVSPNEAKPRGYTPLYDAIGRAVSSLEQTKPDKAVIVVITDGAENASIEMTKDSAKKALDRCRERNWQVVFIGADFDAMAQGASVGNAVGQTMSMNAGSYAAATTSLARKTRAYGNQAWVGSGVSGQSISFSAEDRAEAAGQLGVKVDVQVKNVKGDGA